ncbi:hypothetical protein BHM03_00046166 [Ensete ventricosum]|nr:hypothetical protein BHM03_00046166 [Ensete ventricosum]
MEIQYPIRYDPLGFLGGSLYIGGRGSTIVIGCNFGYPILISSLPRLLRRPALPCCERIAKKISDLLLQVLVEARLPVGVTAYKNSRLQGRCPSVEAAPLVGMTLTHRGGRHWQEQSPPVRWGAACVGATMAAHWEEVEGLVFLLAKV